MKVSICLMTVLCLVTLTYQKNNFRTNNLARNFQNARNVDCGGTGRNKRLRLRNPTTLPTECVYNIAPASAFVCQLRIDFDLLLQPPTTAETTIKCEQDSFSVGNLELCGVNRNQHIYLPFNITRSNIRETLQLKFKIADRFTTPGLGFVSWDLRITQLECSYGSPRMAIGSRNSIQSSKNEVLNPFLARTFFNDGFLIAPNGCLQYFPQAQGVIESFNYNAGVGPYLPNLDYAICFRKRESDTKITLNVKKLGMASVAADSPGYDANCFPSEVAENGNEDYLLIPNSRTQENLRVTRICGNTLNEQALTVNPSGPFVFNFHSDGRYSDVELGFQIEYKIE